MCHKVIFFFIFFSTSHLKIDFFVPLITLLETIQKDGKMDWEELAALLGLKTG